nr:polyprotein [ssRNA positive-strand virus sp.]
MCGRKLFNDVNVHEKLESLLKEEPILHMKQSKVRSIMWQNYWVAAVYAPIMVELKNRLIQVLDHRVLYTIGLRPDQIAARLRLVTGDWILCNDLTQQDRQTDHPMLEKEMAVYRLLGVSEVVLMAYRSLHTNWRYKGDGFRGTCDAMRLTGQPSTAIGNVIVNLIVHLSTVKLNKTKLRMFLCLGDDGAIIFEGKPTIGDLKETTKTHHNMFSKPDLRHGVGIFCRFVVYRHLDGHWGLGPDYVRLRNRYEFTNGVSDLTWPNLHARAMSYMMSLGKIPEVESLNQLRNYGLPLALYYNQSMVVQRTGQFYGMSDLEVLKELGMLLHMLYTMEYHIHEWLVFSKDRRSDYDPEGPVKVDPKRVQYERSEPCDNALEARLIELFMKNDCRWKGQLSWVLYQRDWVLKYSSPREREHLAEIIATGAHKDTA